MTCILLSVSSVPHIIRSRGKINRILMAKQALSTITIPFFCSCYQPIFYLHFFLKTTWRNKMEIWISSLTIFSPMLHYTLRATRTMGKDTYSCTFRFFPPTFFLHFLLWCWDHRSLHAHQHTPVSLHPLFCPYSTLSPLHTWTANPREKQHQIPSPLSQIGAG